MKRSYVLAWVVWPVGVGVFLLLLYALFSLPPRPEPFDKGAIITGWFQKAYYGGGLSGPDIGEEHNKWKFEFIVTDEEAASQQAQGQQIHGAQEEPRVTIVSTGNWCNELPAEGTLVRLENPTGFTSRVTITDLETGRVYRSEGRCLRPTFIYNVRITYAGNDEFLFQDKVEAHDAFDLMDIYSVYFNDSQYEVRYWKEGEPAP